MIFKQIRVCIFFTCHGWICEKKSSSEYLNLPICDKVLPNVTTKFVKLLEDEKWKDFCIHALKEKFFKFTKNDKNC